MATQAGGAGGLWSVWNSALVSHWLSISVAISFSWMILYLTRILAHLILLQDMPNNRSFVQRLKREVASDFSFGEVWLALDMALQFPIIVAFHPIVSLGDFADFHQRPNTRNFLAQLLGFVAVDIIAGRIAAPFFSTQFGEDGDEAAHWATVYTASRSTLLIEVTLVQILVWLDHGGLVGSIHLTTLWVWLVIRGFIKQG